MDTKRRRLLSQIPSIHSLLQELQQITTLPPSIFHKGATKVLQKLRKDILALPPEDLDTFLIDRKSLLTSIEGEGELLYNSLKEVINGTGILLHTNLGRAPLSQEALKRIYSLGGSYSNLEYDCQKGKRGSRYMHLKGLLCQLTGAQDALVVNNNAACVLLILDTLAQNQEVIVSRGELIEIGGSFRLPEVMEKAKVHLVEVGTTNRTSLNDYQRAIRGETALLLKSHQSNFRIMGYTKEVQVEELVALSKDHGVPFYYDMGSGHLLPFPLEPTVQEIVAKGVSLISFSGDKLLGGPQAGIILGEEKYIEALRKNPLTRALRVGKLTLIALGETLKHYLHQETHKIPFYRSLNTPLSLLEERGHRVLQELKGGRLQVDLVKGNSEIGGGSLPLMEVETRQIHITSAKGRAQGHKERLLYHSPPIICRVKDETLILDLLTIKEEEIPMVINALKEL